MAAGLMYDVLMHVGLGTGVCPFHDDPVEAVAQALRERILAQPLAIESLSAALSAWHYRQVFSVLFLVRNHNHPET